MLPGCNKDDIDRSLLEGDWGLDSNRYIEKIDGDLVRDYTSTDATTLYTINKDKAPNRYSLTITEDTVVSQINISCSKRGKIHFDRGFWLMNDYEIRSLKTGAMEWRGRLLNNNYRDYYYREEIRILRFVRR